MHSSHQLYCADQIHVPPNLPPILKEFTKAAIRTQPYNLLHWSAAYFKAIANGEKPPMKSRLEFPTREAPSGLTFGYLQMLCNQLGHSGKIKQSLLKEQWLGVSLPKNSLEDLLNLGNFQSDVDFLQFIALAAGTLEKNLKSTMILLCELLTQEPDGGSAMIPLETFLSLYQYLAHIECGPENPYSKINAKEEFVPDDSYDTLTEINFLKLKELEEAKSRQTWNETLKKIMEMGKSEEILIEGPLEEGIMEWSQISDSDISEPVIVGDVPSDEGLTSAYGVQVWDDGEHDVQEVHLIEGSQVSTQLSEEHLHEEEIEEVQEMVEEEHVLSSEGVESEATDGPELEEDEEEEEIDLVTGEISVHPIKASKKTDGERDGKLKKGVAEVEDLQSKKDQGVVTFLEPTNVPLSARGSDMDIEPSGGKVKDLTECSTMSVGTQLRKRISLADVRVSLATKERSIELKPAIDDKPLTKFWMHVPGIGPAVPEEMVQRAVKYFQECSKRQEGMLLPRNLYHFLCPLMEVIDESI